MSTSDSHRNKSVLSKIFFSLLFLCGDIQLNPGPYKYPCGICAKPVKSNQRGIQCDSCNIWYHIRCMNMNISTYDALANSSCVWECIGCGLLNFFNSLLDSSTDTICSNRFSLHHGSFISEDKCPSDVSSLSPPTLTSSPIPKPKLPKLQKKRHLKGMIINCNGLKGTPRFTQLQALLDLYKPDIVPESKLDKEIPTYSVFPTNYTVFRKDRASNGVFQAVKSDLICEDQPTFSNESEILWTSLKLYNSKPIYLAICYRPPNSHPDVLDKIQDQ